MFKALTLGLLLSLPALASLRDLRPVAIQGLSESEGVALLKREMEEGTYVLREKSFALENKGNYSSGDFVILWGIGGNAHNQSMTESEYKSLWKIMNYLSQKEFRVIMNVRSNEVDLADALSSRTTSVILWSSHGNKDGIYSFEDRLIPYDIFRRHAPNVYQIIVSACEGAKALRLHYNMPTDLMVFAWEGDTDSNELLKLLMSSQWTGFEGKP